MENIQVLVATMHQTDLSIAEKMNIRCSAVIANQADREEIVNKETELGSLKMITTATRGVGLNRNIALLAAESDIVLMADDDVVYNEDAPAQVVKAFQDNPKADIIIFGVDLIKKGQIIEKRHLLTCRRYVWNSLKFGTYVIAARRKSLLRENILFHQCFGGGCEFSSGEDSLFIKSCFDAGLKIYSHEYVLGTCCKDTSSWFKGYNEKYFYDKGVLVRHLFPKIAYIMALYFGICFKRKTNISVFKRIKFICSGVISGKKMIPYSKKYEKNHYSQQ